LEAVLDLLSASDPGLTRFMFAVRVLVSVLVTVLVLAVAGFPLISIMMGATLALNTAAPLNAGTTREQLTSAPLLPIAAVAVLFVESMLPREPIVIDVVFLVVIFLAIYVRKYGPRGMAIGMVAFMGFFIALFVQLQPGQLPAAFLAAVIGVAVAIAVVVLLRSSRHRVLDRMIRALWAWLARVVDLADWLLAGDDPDRRRQQLERGIERLHECALMIEAELDDLVDPTECDEARHRLVSIELAAERLVLATRTAVTEGISEEHRRTVEEELRHLRLLLRRDPRPALIADEERMLAMVRSIKPGRDNPPAARLHRAIRELALVVVMARRQFQPGWSQDTDPPQPEEIEKPADSEETKAESDEPAGLDPAMRQAVQAVVAAAVAIAVGELLSPQRWYWAVITAFVVFLGTNSRGDLLVKGVGRVLGTVLGVVAGLFVAVLAAGHPGVALTGMAIGLFLTFYLLTVSYSMSSFFITVTLGLLYDVLGTYTNELFLVRLAETAVGAAAGCLAGVFVLPNRTTEVVRDQVATFLETLREFVDDAVEVLVFAEAIDLIDEAREVDRQHDEVAKLTTPLQHRMNPFRERRDAIGHLMTLLGLCAFHTRALAAAAQIADLAGHPETADTGRRISTNLERLAEALRAESRRVELLPPGPELDIDDEESAGVRRLLIHLDRLDESVVALARPLGLTEEVTNPVPSGSGTLERR
jgi:uncharacterized membrane protein YccC